MNKKLQRILLGQLVWSAVFLSLMFSSCQPPSQESKQNNNSAAANQKKLPTATLPQDEQSVLFLGMGEHQGIVQMSPKGQLSMTNRVYAFTRELTRQAVLIAARDELGLTTRDEMLGESVPENKARPLILEFNVGTYPAFNDAQIEFHPVGTVFQRDVYHKNHTPALAYVPFQFQILTVNEHFRAIEELEADSRNAFVETLKTLKMKPTVLPHAKSSVEMPESIQERLRDLTPVAQYDAVRQIHKLIREQGESLPLLTGLVRGYAQLYLLSEHHFTTGSRVFQCRAILYAQRAIAVYGETSETTALKGAALGLGSFLGLSRSVFENMDEKDKTAMNGSAVWIRVAQAFSEYDFEAVQKFFGDKDAGNLAKLVYYLMYEYADVPSLTRRKGEELTKDFPCIRILDGMMRMTEGFDSVSVAGNTAYQNYYGKILSGQLTSLTDAEKVLGDLSKIPGSPFAKQSDYVMKLENTTLADDLHEMSLQSLARLIREEAFVQIYHIAKGIRGHNGDPHQFLQSIEPLVADHPLKLPLMILSKNRQYIRTLLEPFLKLKIPYPLIDISAYLLWTHFPEEFNNKIASPGPIGTVFASVECFRETFWIYYREKNNPFVRFGGGSSQVELRLRCVAPNNPLSIAVTMRNRWRFNSKQLEKWQKELINFPPVADAVAERLIKTADFETLKSIRENVYESTKNYATAYNLASFYVQNGKPEEAVEVLKRYRNSKESEAELSNASAARDIAAILNEAKRFDEALPFAKQAAETYSAWGLSILAATLELQGQFDQANKTLRSMAENYSYYPDSAIEWFAFCQRTEHQSLAEAEKDILNQRKKILQNGGDISEYTNFFKLKGIMLPPDQPMSTELFLHSGKETDGWQTVLEILEQKDDKKWNEMYPLFRGEWAQNGFAARNLFSSPSFSMFVNIIELDRQQPERGNLNEDEINFMLQSAGGNRLDHSMISRYLYCFGRYFDLCGKREKAIAYYKKCVAQTDRVSIYARNYALNELRKDGFTAKDYLNLVKDPAMRIPLRFYPQGIMDRICRTVFRDYSDKPSADRLKPVKEPQEEIKDPEFTMNPLTRFESGFYCKVVGGKFFGQDFTPTQSILRVRVKEGRLTVYGFGEPLIFLFEAVSPEAETTQVRLTDWYSEATFRGLFQLSGSKAVFCLNLDDNGGYPTGLKGDSLTNRIVMEMDVLPVIP